MLPIELSVPLGIGTPPWPTYEPLQMKYFKRLAPNGANGQILTHSNHVGTHRWIGVDCGSADHPMNTIIRNWMPRQAKEADAHFQKKYGQPLADFYDDSKYQLMHIELFNHGIIHAECLGGDIDLLLNRRAVIGAFPWRLVDGESCICRILAFLPDDEHEELMKKKQKAAKTRFGDIVGSLASSLHQEARASRAPTKPGKEPARPRAARKR